MALLVAWFGMKPAGRMRALLRARPRGGLRVGARAVREGLRSGARPRWRLEVAIWALLQSLVVWMAVATAMLLGGCASFDGSRPHATALDGAQLLTSKTLGAGTAADVNADAAAREAAADLWPADAWWKAFGDPQLNALIDEALQDGGAITLRLADARLRSAQALAREAGSRDLPTLDLNASSTRERFSAHYIYPPPLGGSTRTLNQATVDLRYELDFWGRNRAAISTARSQVRAARADAQAARLALTTSIARAWFQLQRLASLRNVTLEAIRQRENLLALAKQRFDAGLDTNVEVRQAEAALPASRVELAQIDESVGLVRNQIAALLGKGPDRGRDIGVPDGKGSTVIALPAELPAELIGRRPDVAAARWRVEAACGQIDAAKAQFYPNINLVASAGLLALGGAHFLDWSSRNLSAGPAVSLPIFEGGRLRARLAGKNAEYDAAVEQYNATLVDAVKDVADQVVSLQSVGAQLADQELARIKTGQAFDVAMIRYKAGLATYLTVLNAQTSVLQQQRADAELRARVLDLDVALARALGGGYRSAAATAAATPLAEH